jgi:hypothetical protein
MSVKMAQIPDDVKPYIPEILRALRRALEIGEFDVVVGYNGVRIETLDVRAYISKNHLHIMYKDIDIVYRDYTAVIKVFRKPYIEPEIYYAHDYWSTLNELYELAREKVKERLEKILTKI